MMRFMEHRRAVLNLSALVLPTGWLAGWLPQSEALGRRAQSLVWASSSCESSLRFCASQPARPLIVAVVVVVTSLAAPSKRLSERAASEASLASLESIEPSSLRRLFASPWSSGRRANRRRRGRRLRTRLLTGRAGLLPSWVIFLFPVSVAVRSRRTQIDSTWTPFRRGHSLRWSVASVRSFSGWLADGQHQYVCCDS